ncbi:response regulator transcription factor [Natronosporangium hydrolyticum]|uniref:Response regulator transcription factor n=1 Tax=Natronosporangium hydrolyticum TaxID=2811111 RepID=A0A895Y8F2_9ACTN|nr:response regulator transcription factor [Natronosporangium hydrolyticum]QSB14004.1 response regulator transcription factor [Natronosporangium hydrolyticum]
MSKPHTPHWAGSGDLQILVAVGDELIRCGVSQLLSGLSMVGSVVECSGVEGAVSLLGVRDFDVVLVSVSGGVEGVGEVVGVAGERGASSLLLLRSAEDGLTSEWCGLGADGFLLEAGLSRAVLLEALQKLRQGDMPMPGVLARRMLDELHGRGRGQSREGSSFLLTPRERQALVLLAEGLSNKQIARRLGISEHGAKRHVGNVLAKLNCPNRTVAVAVALHHGLLADGEKDAPTSSSVVGERRRLASRSNVRRRTM